MTIKRLDWMDLWDDLREILSTRTSWGRTQILEEMNKLEQAKIREIEREHKDE